VTGPIEVLAKAETDLLVFVMMVVLAAGVMTMAM
jgi:hypothetical protein